VVGADGARFIRVGWPGPGRYRLQPIRSDIIAAALRGWQGRKNPGSTGWSGRAAHAT